MRGAMWFWPRSDPRRGTGRERGKGMETLVKAWLL
jgi:hypothetical protein